MAIPAPWCTLEFDVLCSTRRGFKHESRLPLLSYMVLGRFHSSENFSDQETLHGWPGTHLTRAATSVVWEHWAMLRCILVGFGLVLFAPTWAASPFDISTFRGRVVYLDFWASWCGPCRQSFPWMQTLKNTYEDQGLTIVAVNLDADRVDAEKFLNQFKPTFDVRYDPDGKLAEVYTVKSMPSSVLIDRHGVTRFPHMGFRPVDGAVYEAQLRELLAEK
jgi:cytochrome c biogenesis protein CcmG, thiol:disulfide interchange protein DsbE